MLSLLTLPTLLLGIFPCGSTTATRTLWFRDSTSLLSTSYLDSQDSTHLSCHTSAMSSVLVNSITKKESKK